MYFLGIKDVVRLRTQLEEAAYNLAVLKKAHDSLCESIFTAKAKKYLGGKVNIDGKPVEIIAISWDFNVQHDLEPDPIFLQKDRIFGSVSFIDLTKTGEFAQDKASVAIREYVAEGSLFGWADWPYLKRSYSDKVQAIWITDEWEAERIDHQRECCPSLVASE